MKKKKHIAKDHDSVEVNNGQGNSLGRFIKFIKRYITFQYVTTILSLIIGAAALYLTYDSSHQQEKPLSELCKKTRANNLAKLEEAERLVYPDSIPEINEAWQLGSLADEALSFMRYCTKYDFSFERSNYSNNEQMIDDLGIMTENMRNLTSKLIDLIHRYVDVHVYVGYTSNYYNEDYEVDVHLLHLCDDMVDYEDEIDKYVGKNISDEKAAQVMENTIRIVLFKNDRIEKMQELALQIRKWSIAKLDDLTKEPYVLVHPNETISIFPNDTIILKKRHPLAEEDTSHYIGNCVAETIERWKRAKVDYDKQLEEYNSIQK